jgi:2Fe-2S ferredoxin
MPKMIFIERDGSAREVDAPLGLSVLEIAHRNKIDIEGACEGSLACSTCHVIVDPDWYDLLKEATEDEEDMLDLAFGLTVTSRLARGPGDSVRRCSVMPGTLCARGPPKDVTRQLRRERRRTECLSVRTVYE